MFFATKVGIIFYSMTRKIERLQLRCKYEGCCTNSHYGEKAKAMRIQLSTKYLIINYVLVKVQGEDGTFLPPRHKTLHHEIMYKTYLHKAIEAVPKFEERISLSNFVFLLRTSE